MALEHRNGQVYYYRSRRVRKRVRKEYVTSGECATVLANLDALKRAEKEFAALQMKAKREKWQTRSDRLRKALARANRTVAEALRADGWHQHKREWRKRRGPTMSTDLAIMLGTWTLGESAQRAGTLPDDVSKKAAKGDRSALPAVRQYLNNPAAVALWGNVGALVLQSWVQLFGSGDLRAEEAMIRRLQAMREGLTGPNPTALDVLLVERVVLAWAALSVLELWYTQAFSLLLGKKAADPTRSVILDVLPKHIDYANRQLMAACRTLAKVRRAQLPELLAVVNVGTVAQLEQERSHPPIGANGERPRKAREAGQPQKCSTTRRECRGHRVAKGATVPVSAKAG